MGCPGGKIAAKRQCETAVCSLFSAQLLSSLYAQQTLLDLNRIYNSRGESTVRSGSVHK